MLILAASLRTEGTPQGENEELSHRALSSLPQTTPLQASQYTGNPAADGQTSLQVSWGRSLRKGPFPAGL